MSVASKALEILVAKDDIKAAIESKGVTVGNAPLDQYANKIGQISGGGGGGFRCTNKMLGNGELIWAGNTSYQYTFDGTLQEAGIGLISNWGGQPLSLSSEASRVLVSYNTLSFSDIHTASGGISYGGHHSPSLISSSLTFTDGEYYSVTVSIDNTGVLSTHQTISGDSEWQYCNFVIFFRGADGTIDFDIVPMALMGEMD